MNTFTPQRVAWRSVFDWTREGLELLRRQPIWFAGVGAAWSMLAALPAPYPLLLLLGLPLPLAAGCLVASAADHSDSPLAALRALTRQQWLDMLLCGALPWLFVIGLLFALTAPAESASGYDLFAGVPVIENAVWPACATLLVVMFLWLCTVGFVGWFMVPLLAVAQLPLLEAWRQAVRAIQLNTFVIALVFAIAWLAVPVASLLSPLLAVPLFALLSASMYTSFRHIWLGRGKNEPAAARSGDLAMAPAA